MRSESHVVYLPHGGGPLPLLGDPEHKDLSTFLATAAPHFGHPSGALIISAHWESPVAAITSTEHPALIYDYYGFPPESYRIRYPVPGSPRLAARIAELLGEAGVEARLDERRGLDHGVFVPMKLMYPQAKLPCVQLSLLGDLNPASHIALGRALAPLRAENVLIIGSGLSFHNLGVFFGGTSSNVDKSAVFDDWLNETLVSSTMTADERERRLLDWEEAPFARYCHPREEHLLPLHVCAGAASMNSGHTIYNATLYGKRVSGFLW